MNAASRPTRAGVCTAPADLAQQLDALLKGRDRMRTLWERHHAHLVDALQVLPGANAARDRAHCAWACIEAGELAADAALSLALDALRGCGVVVDVPADAAGEPAAADQEGIEP